MNDLLSAEVSNPTTKQLVQNIVEHDGRLPDAGYLIIRSIGLKEAFEFVAEKQGIPEDYSRLFKLISELKDILGMFKESNPFVYSCACFLLRDDVESKLKEIKGNIGVVPNTLNVFSGQMDPQRLTKSIVMGIGKIESKFDRTNEIIPQATTSVIDELPETIVEELKALNLDENTANKFIESLRK
jgi:hypothetical protein